MVDAATLADAAAKARAKGPPPVHLWNPPDCGDIDMRIAADGSWHYLGTPIGRPAMVRLFASILRRDGDRHVLVTPVEKVGIRVDDAPFTAVELDRRAGPAGQELCFRTNVDDWTTAGPAHDLVFRPEGEGVFRPYVHVRGDLWARVLRPLWFELVALAVTGPHAGAEWLGVESVGRFFPIAPMSGIGTAP
jgi:hypothetical protein